MSKNLGIGKVFTYKLTGTKNVGYGYIQPQNYAKTKNVGIGKMKLANIQGDPSEGLVIVDSESVYVVSGEESLVPPVPVVAPMTLRFSFSNESSDPNTLGMTKGTWTKVEDYDGEYVNVWDWTYDNPDWSGAFSQKLTSSFDPDIKIIDAGDTSNVTDLTYLFSKASGLTEVCLFDTSNVISMRGMFADGCTKLTTVPLFDTSNVKDMCEMFWGCSSLTSVPLFDTSKVTDMRTMFCSCTKLTTVPLFDTSNVTEMSEMFWGCSSLTSVPYFDTTKVTNMYRMFYCCTALTSVQLFETSSVTNMSNMFYGCRSIESGMLALYNQAKDNGIIQNFTNCFTGAGTETESGMQERAQIPTSWGGDLVVLAANSIRLAFSNNETDPSSISGGTWTKVGYYASYDNVWDFTRNTSNWSMALNDKLTSELDIDIKVIKSGDLSQVTTMESMFSGCTGLTQVFELDTSNVTSFQSMFSGCSRLVTIPENMGSENLTTINNMFNSCSALTYIPQMNTSNVTLMPYAFANCTSLLRMPVMDTSNVTNMVYMFLRCESLRDVSVFYDISKVTKIRSMLEECKNIESGMVRLYNAANATGIVEEHSYCFRDAGTNTVTGMEERALIPVSWGGDKSEIGAMTMRFSFATGFDPLVSASKCPGTWTKLESGIYNGFTNVWDYYYNSNDWTEAFATGTLTKYTSYIPETAQAILVDHGDLGILVYSSSKTGLFGHASTTAGRDSVESKWLVGVEKLVLPVTGVSNTTKGLFGHCVNLKYVKNLDFANATNAQLLFFGCSNLETVNVKNTSNITNMGSMFRYCSSLVTAPSFDTTRAINMGAMFNMCTALTTVPTYITSNVTNFSGMFMGCSSLVTAPDLNTSKATTMNDMFNGCSSLTTTKQYDTANVTTMANMFNNCTSLVELDHLFNTTNVTTMANMFKGCTSLDSCPRFAVTKLTNVSGMYQDCVNLEYEMFQFYQSASATGLVTTYTDCFTNAGVNTHWGMLNRAEIPISWGGDMADFTITIESIDVDYYSKFASVYVNIDGDGSQEASYNLKVTDSNSSQVYEMTDMRSGTHALNFDISSYVGQSDAQFTVTCTDNNSGSSVSKPFTLDIGFTDPSISDFIATVGSDSLNVTAFINSAHEGLEEYQFIVDNEDEPTSYYSGTTQDVLSVDIPLDEFQGSGDYNLILVVSGKISGKTTQHPFTITIP